MIDWYRSLTVVVVGMFDFHSCSVPAAGSLALSPRCRRRDMDDGYGGNDKTNAAVATRRKVTAMTTTTATAETIGAVSTEAKTTTTTIII